MESALPRFAVLIPRRPSLLALHTIKLLTGFFLLLNPGDLQANVWKYAQHISVEAKNAPLDRVLQIIEKQSGFTFVYNDRVLKIAKRVTIKVKNMPLQDVLSEVFRGQPLTWHIIDKVIVVKGLTEKKITVATGEASSGYPFLAIEGVVTDESGTPLAGVSVMVKGKSKGTRTNHRGEFALIGVNSGEVLVLTSVGYEKKEVTIDDETKLRIQMKVAVGSLDEVQVIAYGVTSKRFSTGNISSVNARDIEKQPVNNPLLALQGRVPGLTVEQNTGVPGGGITVRVQGQNSISALNGNDPLFVINGVPYISQMPGTTFGGYSGGLPILGNSGGPSGSGGGNPLNYINPADIESIVVLKDADATAIYGSRAANGAILITTKQGKPGRTKLNVNVRKGWGQVPEFLDMMNTQQYLAMRHEAFLNDAATPNTETSDFDVNGLWDTTRYTDWQEVLIGGTADFGSYTAGISGGEKNVQFLISGTFQRETSVFPGDFDDRKGSIYFNLNGTSDNRKFEWQLSGMYLADRNRLPGFDLTNEATKLAPNAPELFNPDGSLNWEPAASGISSWNNPLAFLQVPFEARTKNLVASGSLWYEIISGLKIGSSFGYTDLRNTEFSAMLSGATPPEFLPFLVREARYHNSNVNSWIVEPQINYKLNLNKSKLEFLVGSTIQQRNTDGEQIMGLGHNSDQVIRDIKAAPSLVVLSSIDAVYKYNALFGRINYNLLNKYIINLTGRRDGSSRFGQESRFHNFGSVGAAWIFSQESFIKNNLRFLTFGKIRGSYGTTGNDQIPDYAFMPLYGIYNPAVPYQGATGLIPNVLPNPLLEWEETRKLQAGIDLGMFADRVLLTVNYVRNRSSNQLLDFALPSTTGFISITDNFPATVENTAWEFSATTANFKRSKFRWNTSFNITIPKNELVKFPNLESSSYASTLVIGEPIEIQRVYRFLGVDPTTGIYHFAGTNGNSVSEPVDADRTVIIPLNPRLYGGLQNTFELAGFRLDFLFQFVKQDGINFLWNNIPGRFARGRGNQPVDVLDRWQKPGDVATYQRYSQNTSLTTPSQAAELSNFWYKDASFIRLKNASLSWSFPEKWRRQAKLEYLRLFVQGQNLITITDFQGLDPESQRNFNVPPLRMVALGLELTL